jgi:hypothetical protein
MQLSLQATQDERHACRRAAVYVRGIAAGLKGSSDKDAEQCDAYAATLEAVSASGDSVRLDDDQKVHVEQASFLLEGIATVWTTPSWIPVQKWSNATSNG